MLNLILVSSLANPFDKNEICMGSEGLGRAERGLVYILVFPEGKGQEYKGAELFSPSCVKGDNDKDPMVLSKLDPPLKRDKQNLILCYRFLSVTPVPPKQQSKLRLQHQPHPQG